VTLTSTPINAQWLLLYFVYKSISRFVFTSRNDEGNKSAHRLRHDSCIVYLTSYNTVDARWSISTCATSYNAVVRTSDSALFGATFVELRVTHRSSMSPSSSSAVGLLVAQHPREKDNGKMHFPMLTSIYRLYIVDSLELSTEDIRLFISNVLHCIICWLCA